MTADAWLPVVQATIALPWYDCWLLCYAYGHRRPPGRDLDPREVLSRLEVCLPLASGADCLVRSKLLRLYDAVHCSTVGLEWKSTAWLRDAWLPDAIAHGRVRVYVHRRPGRGESEAAWRAALRSRQQCWILPARATAAGTATVAAPLLEPERTFFHLEVVGGDGKPLAGVAWRVVDPEGVEHRGMTGPAGLVRIDDLAYGECTYALPDRLRDPVPGGAIRRDRTAQPGESLAHIAHAEGAQVRDLLALSENAHLRQRCGNQHQLLEPGEVIALPDLRERQQRASTSVRHRVLVPGVPMQVRVQVLHAGRPAAQRDGAPVRGTIALAGSDPESAAPVQLDADGVLAFDVMPEVASALLRLVIDGEDVAYDLRFGSLEPTTTATGTRQHLANLGYLAADADSADDAAVQRAVAAFQRDSGHAVTGTVDLATATAPAQRGQSAAAAGSIPPPPPSAAARARCSPPSRSAATPKRGP